MPLQKKDLMAGLLVVIPWLLGGVMRPLGRLLGIPMLLSREDWRNFLVSSVSEQAWRAAALYHIVFLVVTCLALALAMKQIVISSGWRYALLIVAPFSATLLAFWPKEEVAIIFVFGALALPVHYLDRMLKARKRRPGRAAAD